MKILSITAQKPHSTGSGTYLTELVNEFARTGHQQAVVCGIYKDDNINFAQGVKSYPVYFSLPNSEDDKSDSVHLEQGTDAIPFPVVGMSDVMPYPSTKYSDMNMKMIGDFEQSFSRIIDKAVEELDPDIILCHHLFLLTAIVRKNYPNRKVYGICHGSDLRQFINCKHLQFFVKPEIAKLDKLFALHDTQKQTIAELYGQELNSKISVIGSGYNESIFNLDGRIERTRDAAVKICYAGKMSEAKGVPELLDVLEELNANKTSISSSSDNDFPFEACLAGGCQDLKIKERLSSLPSNIRYLGQLSQIKLAEEFKKSDIFILPSYFEGLGLVLIEAMASGMIPISTDLPGIKEWINDNVTNPNVKYIPMPEMAGVDEPTEAGRENFKKDMKEILMSAIKEVSSGQACEASRPDTSQITWNAVCRSILEP